MFNNRTYVIITYNEIINIVLKNNRGKVSIFMAMDYINKKKKIKNFHNPVNNSMFSSV